MLPLFNLMIHSYKKKTFIIFLIFLLSRFLCLADPMKIDVVYTWVNGNDLEWKKIKNYYLDREQNSCLLLEDSANSSRFQDHQELKYSLRSIQEYAPFIRHIFIVTMEQKPSWIKDHDKITFIDHKDIFKNLEDLPTFNSQAIEANLHRIEDLSEYFLYFNDDVFLGKKVKESNFFTENGEPIILIQPTLTPKYPLNQNSSFYQKAWANTNQLLDSLYGAHPRFRLRHAPFALKKSLIAESETIFPSIFETNSKHKFRSEYDYNIVNGLIQYDWLYRKKCVIGNASNLMVSLRCCAYQHHNLLEFQKLHFYNPTTFCIEDVVDGYCQEAENLLHEFLDKKYPIKAPWEK